MFHKGIEPLVADVDVLVYKVLLRNDDLAMRFHAARSMSVLPEWYRPQPEYCTPVMREAVIFDDNYEADLRAQISGYGDRISVFYKEDDKAFFVGNYNIEEGIHSYFLKTAANELLSQDDTTLRLCVAVIPANTGFFIGQNGDVVSNRLIIYQTPDAMALKKRNAVPLKEWLDTKFEIGS